MQKERTLVLVKPDGVRRSLVGEIISRFENVGLKILGMKMFWADKDFAQRHYTDDISKRHGERVRNNLVQYITEGPVVAFVLEGVDAVKVVRKIAGSTYGGEAISGTIRGDYSHTSKDYANFHELKVKNLVHSSGSLEEAKFEIPLWFDEKELHEYKTIHDMIEEI